MTSTIVKFTALFKSGKITIPGRHELVRVSPYLQMLHGRGEYNLVLENYDMDSFEYFMYCMECGAFSERSDLFRYVEFCGYFMIPEGVVLRMFPQLPVMDAFRHYLPAVYKLMQHNYPSVVLKIASDVSLPFELFQNAHLGSLRDFKRYFRSARRHHIWLETEIRPNCFCERCEQVADQRFWGESQPFFPRRGFSKSKYQYHDQQDAFKPC